MPYTLFQSTVDIRGGLSNLTSGPHIQTNLGTSIASLAGFAILIGALLTFMYLIIAGMHWVTAGGDKGKIEKAQSMIIQSIIGLAVLAASFAIFSVVQYFFGINIVNSGNDGTSVIESGGNGGGTGGGTICTKGTTANDGGVGNYCTNNGAATVKCTTTTNIPYLHWEPCGCVGNNVPRPGTKFIIGC